MTLAEFNEKVFCKTNFVLVDCAKFFARMNQRRTNNYMGYTYFSFKTSDRLHILSKSLLRKGKKVFTRTEIIGERDIKYL